MVAPMRRKGSATTSRGISFGELMARRLSLGEKRMTRRGLSHEPEPHPIDSGRFRWRAGRYGWWAGDTPPVEEMVAFCPIAVPGDTLYVREPWVTESRYDHLSPAALPPAARVWYLADGAKPDWAGRYRQARFMPRSRSRFDLLVLGVRVERLQDISAEDAVAEGVVPLPLQQGEAGCWWSASPEAPELHARSPREGFRKLWVSLYGDEGWDANPWMYSLSFDVVRRIRATAD